MAFFNRLNINKTDFYNTNFVITNLDYLPIADKSIFN